MFKRILFAIKLRRIKRKADRLAKQTRTRLYVIYLNGKMHITTRSAITALVRMKRFKKGVTVDMILDRALYKTPKSK